jgi:hypothetical protein
MNDMSPLEPGAELNHRLRAFADVRWRFRRILANDTIGATTPATISPSRKNSIVRHTPVAPPAEVDPAPDSVVSASGRGVDAL